MAFRSFLKTGIFVTAAVGVLFLIGIAYSLRDKRFILEYPNNAKEVSLKIDDVDVSVAVFLDYNMTIFYDAYDWNPERPFRTCQRILIAFQNHVGGSQNLLSVSQRGIGVVGGRSCIWKLGGKRCIVQNDCEGVDYDVRGDMKGLGADVERRCMPDYVEYVVSRRQEPPRQIVLKIGIALYNSVFAEESKAL